MRGLISGPGTQFEAIKLLPAGTVLELLAVEGRWMNVSVIENEKPAATGFVHSAYVEEI